MYLIRRVQHTAAQGPAPGALSASSWADPAGGLARGGGRGAGERGPRPWGAEGQVGAVSGGWGGR